MRRAAKAAGILTALAVMLCALAAMIYGIAGNGTLLAEEMLRHAPPEDTGLPEAEYGPVGQMTAAWLTGKAVAFQHTFTGSDGSVYQCFQPHEAAHMADCRDLILLAERLRWICGGAALLFFAAGLLIGKERKAFRRGMILGLRAAGAAACVLLIWGLIDFDGLFTVFHRVAFTNEGWLLNPKTDLLIRLMPTALFTALAARGMIWMAAAGMLLDVAARLPDRRKRAGRANRKRQNDEGI